MALDKHSSEVYNETFTHGAVLEKQTKTAINHYIELQYLVNHNTFWIKRYFMHIKNMRQYRYAG